MSTGPDDLDKIAQAAVDKHRRLLLHKVLELTLGDMVAMDGIKEVRKILLWYSRQLRDF